jgi:hypothetical protein
VVNFKILPYTKTLNITIMTQLEKWLDNLKGLSKEEEAAYVDKIRQEVSQQTSEEAKAQLREMIAKVREVEDIIDNSKRKAA